MSLSLSRNNVFLLGLLLLVGSRGPRPTTALNIAAVQTPVVLDGYAVTFNVEVSYAPDELTANAAVGFDMYDQYLDGTTVRLGNFDPQSVWQLHSAATTTTKQDNTSTISLITTFPLRAVIITGLGHHSLILNATMIPSGTTTSITLDVTAMHGVVSIIPIVATLVMAMYTRNVVPSLFVGVWLAALIKYNGNVVDATTHAMDELILNAVIDSGHAAIIIFSLFLGGIVAMTTRSGGLDGFSQALIKYATSSRRAQAMTMSAGACIFFDDYANLLLTGAVMRPITDAQLISREKLAFIVDSMAAPMAAIIPISSWTAFEALLIQREFIMLTTTQHGNAALLGMGYEMSGFSGFIRMVPYMFYPVFVIVFQLTVIITQLEFGPMLTAERRAKYKKQVQVDFDKEDMMEEKVLIADDDPETLPDDFTPRLWYNAAFPILVLVCVTIGSMVGIGYRGLPEKFRDASTVFANTDGVVALLYATSTTIAFTGLFYRLQYRRDDGDEDDDGDANVNHDPNNNQASYMFWHVLPQKIKYYLRLPHDEMLVNNTIPLMGLREAVEMLLFGIKSMSPACVVLVLAWTVGTAVTNIGAPQFFAQALYGHLSIASLSPTVFIVSSFTSVATGSSFGTMALLFPVISPLAFELAQTDSEQYYKCLAAILSGSVFGGHISPISDTTILTSLSTRCDLQQHVITQFPYACVCATWAVLIGYLPQVHPVVGNLVGMLATIVTVLLLGAPVASPRGRLDPLTWLYAQFYVRILKRNPAKLECLRLRVTVIEQEGDKDDVIGQGIRRDYLIWSMRRAFGESRVLIEKKKSIADAKELRKAIEEEDEEEMMMKERRKSRRRSGGEGIPSLQNAA